jgi:hypothetical protein
MMNLTIRVLSILAAIAFFGQITLVSAADEPKKEKKEKKAAVEAPADNRPGGGIVSNKAQAADSPRLTKGHTCSGDAPKIIKINPDEGKTGAKITVTGDRFGEPGCINMVSFGPGSPAKFSQVDDRTITVTVPEGNKGLEFLTVTGSSGEDTKPFLRK